MSVGIPLLTFGIGGIGEYIQQPENSSVKNCSGRIQNESSTGSNIIDSSDDSHGMYDDDGSSNDENEGDEDECDIACEVVHSTSKYDSSFYTVTKNAVLINEASPIAISAAVSLLIANPSLRFEIGAAGRLAIQQRFSLQRQIDDYTLLYTFLSFRKHYYSTKTLQ